MARNGIFEARITLFNETLVQQEHHVYVFTNPAVSSGPTP